jgi:hypothetical protein
VQFSGTKELNKTKNNIFLSLFPHGISGTLQLNRLLGIFFITDPIAGSSDGVDHDHAGGGERSDKHQRLGAEDLLPQDDRLLSHLLVQHHHHCHRLPHLSHRPYCGGVPTNREGKSKIPDTVKQINHKKLEYSN